MPRFFNRDEVAALYLFDRRPDARPVEERVDAEVVSTPGGRQVTVVRA